MTQDAILFRTHFWDAFVQRQFDRLLEHAAGCDVFVLVDETSGPVHVPYPLVVRVTETDMLGMGLVRAGEGNMLWFNGDYPLYRFVDLHPGYTQILQLEYDVTVDSGLGALMARMRKDAVDFIGLTKGEPALQWPWLHTCAALYDPAGMHHQLICLSAYSSRALRHLRARRLAHAALWRSGAITSWPMCEAFIATELAQGGFRLAELSEYGGTRSYDHWPPYLEADLPALRSQGFVHPVLDERRYIASMLKYRVGLGGYLHPASLFHRKLRRLPAPLYASTLLTTFAAKAHRVLRELMSFRLLGGRTT